MKTLIVLMGLFLVSSVQAQNFGLSKSGTSDLTCSLARPAGTLPKGGPIYPCLSKAGAYGIGFAGVAMDIANAAKMGSKLQLKFHCTVGQPQGAFLFGGQTMGFENSAERHERFFYAAGEGNFGRCYITADAALTANLKLTVNQSAMVLIPVKAKAK